MAIGFVLISAAPAHEHEVYNKLSKVPNEADDFEKLGNLVVNKIRSIDGVIDTKTLTGTKF